MNPAPPVTRILTRPPAAELKLIWAYELIWTLL
jgi:hypothetical protein